MKRSSKLIILFLILLCAGVIGYLFYDTPQTHNATSVAAQQTFASAKQPNSKPYQILTKDIPASLINLPPNQIRVIEFFNYACPHCNAFNPYLSAWAKENVTLLTDQNAAAHTKTISTPYIVLDKIPVTFSADWQHYSEAFYIADEAKILTPELESMLFSLSSIDGLKTEAQMRSFFSHHGLTNEAYDKIIRSPEFTQRQSDDVQLEKTLKITGIPTLIVIRDKQVYEINAALPQSLLNTLTLLTKKTLPNP